MYYARQVPPEYQEPYLDLNEDWCRDYIAVVGNKDYTEHMPTQFANVRAALYEGSVAGALDEYRVNPKESVFESEADIITEYLPPAGRSAYSPNEIEKLAELAGAYLGVESMESNNILCEAVSIVTGQEWDWQTIRGCCQREWNEVFYPVSSWNEESLASFEAQYFNTGTEWVIHDGKDVPKSAEEIDGWHHYCTATDEDAMRSELCEAICCRPEELVMWEHTGYTRVEQYREIPYANGQGGLEM